MAVNEYASLEDVDEETRVKVAQGVLRLYLESRDAAQAQVLNGIARRYVAECTGKPEQWAETALDVMTWAVQSAFPKWTEDACRTSVAVLIDAAVVAHGRAQGLTVVTTPEEALAAVAPSTSAVPKG